ncbi:ATP-grasp domain-containing protein [Aquimarina rhabdastrellae]
MNKQIIIQSESNDLSTDDVMSWIYHKNSHIKVDTIFDDYEIDDVSLEMSNENGISGVINDININKKSNYWYRRGQLKAYPKNIRSGTHFQKLMHNETILPIEEFINSGIYHRRVNTFKDNFASKLDMLKYAIALDINIPPVLITGDSTKLMGFVSKYEKVITKPIKNPFINYNTKEYKIRFLTHTKLITVDDIPQESFCFMPSFFQKYIEKKVEIRSFYIDGVFKSMAIFSQQNEKTRIDYRNYDRRRPNRCIPYQLPKELENKLHQLMLKLDINCGSFDVICTPENEYYFLEVNPIGQFQWVSRNCNYYLERLLAEKILKNGERED